MAWVWNYLRNNNRNYYICFNNLLRKAQTKKKKITKINIMDFLNKLITSNPLAYVFAIITGTLIGLGLCKLL